MHREDQRPRSHASVSGYRVIAEGHARREGVVDTSKPFGESAPAIDATKQAARIVRKSTDRRRAPKCIGALDDEPSLIGKRVQQLACTSDVVVWAHEERIFAASANSATKVLSELRIGIYGAGVLLAEIEDDMRKFRRNRFGAESV